MEITIGSIDELSEKVRVLKQYLPKGVILFDGEMGAGKTTIISELCRQLEIEDEPSSPTYSIVNEYYSKAHGTLYHFDCYRLESEEEALDIGIEDYLYSGNYCFVEWGDRIEKLLPENYVRVSVQAKEEHRIITVSE